MSINVQTIIVYALASVFAVLQILHFVYSLIRKGPNKYFKVSKRHPPECLNHKQLGEHRFVTLKKQNIRLHYVINGPENAPVMLFLHGFPEFWYSWHHQIIEFSKTYRTIAIDLRGYGESSKPTNVSQYQTSILATDISEFMDELGIKECTLVGHDWGGAVGFMAAHMFPHKFTRYIACNIPHPKAFQKHLMSNFSQFKKSLYIIFFQIPYLPEIALRSFDLRFFNMLKKPAGGLRLKKISEKDLEAYKYNYCEPGAFTGPLNYYRAAIRYPGDPALTSTKVSVPTMLIWGDHDVALESKMAELSARYVSDFTVRYIQGASHWVQQDAPELVNQFIREFCERKVKDTN